MLPVSLQRIRRRNTRGRYLRRSKYSSGECCFGGLRALSVFTDRRPRQQRRPCDGIRLFGLFGDGGDVRRITWMGGSRNSTGIGFMNLAMTGNGAKWIRRRRLPQDLIIGILQDGFGGKGECSQGSIGASMQGDIRTADRLEKPNRSSTGIGVKPMVPCFLDNFVPQRTEVVLQFRKSIAYVESERDSKFPMRGTGANKMSSDVNKDGK